MLTTHLRVVSWNLAFRVKDAVRQGEFLASLAPAPDLVLLQEVNRRLIDTLCATAQMDWLRCAVDVRTAHPDDTPVRKRGVAIAGRGDGPISVHVLHDISLPERTLIAKIGINGREVTIASYHAPPGVNWFEKKPQQAVAFARWLARVEGPVLFGADMNTPLVDAIDFRETRTHWHTGLRNLRGQPGDDLCFGPDKIHGLDDALRRWLANRPDELDRLRQERPRGPLALSHRTGRRKNSIGTDRRFDAVWVSPHFEVVGVDYVYDRCIAAGSDHAAVVVDVVV